MNRGYNGNSCLDNGLPRCNMPRRFESGRGRSRAASVVIMRNPCRVGTWNVRTMLIEGKLEELKFEMERLNLDILGISEVRWEGSGDYWSGNHRVIYTGDKKGRNGTAIILNKEWGSLVENTIHLSDRLTAIKLNTKSFKVVIVQVYMPTGSYTDSDIDDVYEQIDSVIDTVKSNDNLILMGDFNAVVGEGAEEGVVGRYGLGNRNQRGEKLVQFCKEHDLTILNTKFKQPKRRLYTWKMPGDIGRYQLDYIIMKNKFIQKATTCKTFPGADLNTDHNLLVSSIKLEPKTKSRKHRPKRIDLNKASSSSTKPAVVPVAGVGEVDRAQIAQQMAEALIAQGKTDVSSEDLAQLVDAVVGMAEAKKREAEKNKRAAAPPVVEKPAKPALSKMSGTASALQMLQSAYNENDKKTEVDDVPDVMDGLSDSDLETLLKNFNELSAEEQHSLIAYLKKLEAKEPQRVERLRQYVSEAASTAAKEPEPDNDKEETAPPPSAVVVESDDDDYTVEEVFQSATQKVKEDQIRQEMEIVKKSLEESKPEEVVVEPTTLENSLADISKNLSSASDLFALVQASLKSAPAATPAPLSRSPNVVASTTQPRSFGDLPEPTVTQEPVQPPTQTAAVTSASILNQFVSQGSGQAPFQNQPAGLLRPPVRHQVPNQQQMPQHQQLRPQQQQQQNYTSPQNQHYNQQQNYQPQHSNYQQNNQQNQLPLQHQQHNQQGQMNQPLLNQQYQPQQYNNPQHQQYQQPQHQQQNYNDNRNKNDHFNQGQWNPRGNMMDNRGPPLRGNAPDNFGPNAPYNQGPRNNFMNGRGQDNYDTRPQNMNQQFNNYDNNQNNFRGRGGGRGHFGGPRGRGRGYY